VQEVVMVGAGGMARTWAEAITSADPGGTRLRLLGFLDDGEVNPEVLRGFPPLLGPTSRLAQLGAGVEYFLGLGQPQDRRRFAAVADKLGLSPVVIQHPAAAVHRNSVMAPGSGIIGNGLIGVSAQLGFHTHVSWNGIVSHDCIVGDFVSIRPRAQLSGHVVVEDDCVIGAGATVLEGRRVCAGAVVGAGAVVTRDVPPRTTVTGIPACPTAEA
jgi:sugar O-acyltransferase (sialic acid O-acetyltransferase NeuD family)